MTNLTGYSGISVWLLRFIFTVAFASQVFSQMRDSKHPILKQLHGAAFTKALKQIDHAQLPPRASVDPPLQQVFLLQVPNTPPLGIIAVYLNQDAPGTDPEQCGVFFQQPDGRSRYVPVIGSAQAPIKANCEQVGAVGLEDESSPHPALIFIFSELMAHDGSPTPFVFSWNNTTQQYDRNDPLNDWLWKQKDYPSTVAQVRRLLRQRH